MTIEKLTQANGLKSEIDSLITEQSKIRKLNSKNDLEGLTVEEISELINIASHNTDYVLRIFRKEFDEL